ncbi:MAG: DUF6529 family protein [Thermodesulfovibrionales bacterium]|nr:DUF6529 family protein [Thermodesulfovibrionales bacterium]
MSFLKSLLGIGILISSVVAVFTMLEIFGRSGKKYDIEKLKKIHRANGIVYFLLFILITYFCLDFIINTKTELSPRALIHSLYAVAILLLLGLKFSILRVYRQFYNQVKIIGLLIALISFAMFAASGGYYLLITKFGSDKAFMEAVSLKKEPVKETVKIALKTDPESIGKGKELYESKCYFCHDAYSNKREVGPGHKGILKNPLLPMSKKPATPENVANQIRNPYKDMPSFSYLSDEEVENIIAFLNTL